MATFKNSKELREAGSEAGWRIREKKERVTYALSVLAPAEMASIDLEEVLHCIRDVPRIEDDGRATVNFTTVRGEPYGGGYRSGVRSFTPFHATYAKVVVEYLEQQQGFTVTYYQSERFGDQCARVEFALPRDMCERRKDDDVDSDLGNVELASLARTARDGVASVNLAA